MISDAALYNWRAQAKEQGIAVPGSGKASDQWSAEAKLAVVIETAANQVWSWDISYLPSYVPGLY